MDAPTDSVIAAAAEIRRRQPTISNVRLHNLLYYVQGYHLSWNEEPAFLDNTESWASGPVVGNLWRAEKHGNQECSEPLRTSVRNVITNGICRFGDKPEPELVAATKQEDPWLEANNRKTMSVGKQVVAHKSLTEHFSIESPDLQHMREHLNAVRDDTPFVPDPPGALEALVAEIRARNDSE